MDTIMKAGRQKMVERQKVVDFKSVRGLGMVPAVKSFNQQAVDHLEDLLARAKDGEVSELVVVAKLKDGNFEHSYTGCSDLNELSGILNRMNYLTMRRMD